MEVLTRAKTIQGLRHMQLQCRGTFQTPQRSVVQQVQRRQSFTIRLSLSVIFRKNPRWGKKVHQETDSR